MLWEGTGCNEQHRTLPQSSKTGELCILLEMNVISGPGLWGPQPSGSTLHIYPTPPHLVEESYAYGVVDGVFGALRCIRSQFPGYGFPRRPLLGDSVNKFS